MTEKEDLTVGEIITEEPSKRKERESLTRVTYVTMLELLRERGVNCEIPVRDGLTRKYFPITPFPFLDPSEDSPLYHIRILAEYNDSFEVFTPESFQISCQTSARENPSKLFVIKEDRLEGPPTVNCDDIKELKKVVRLISKIAEAGYKHLSKPAGKHDV
jgi:hypothetical protein